MDQPYYTCVSCLNVSSTIPLLMVETMLLTATYVCGDQPPMRSAREPPANEIACILADAAGQAPSQSAGLHDALRSKDSRDLHLEIGEDCQHDRAVMLRQIVAKLRISDFDMRFCDNTYAACEPANRLSLPA